MYAFCAIPFVQNDTSATADALASAVALGPAEAVATSLVSYCIEHEMHGDGTSLTASRFSGELCVIGQLHEASQGCKLDTPRSGLVFFQTCIRL